jgi:hypothetical protein
VALVGPTLAAAAPAFAEALAARLRERGRDELAEQVASLPIAARCDCGDDFCASFASASEPATAERESVAVEGLETLVVLDVVDGRITYVELLGSDELREAIDAALDA